MSKQSAETTRAWLTETQATVEASLLPGEASLPLPRRRIRAFLRGWFAFLGHPLPDEWPAISPQSYSQLTAAARHALDQLYDEVERFPELTAERRLFPRYLGETALYLMQLDAEQPVEWHEAPDELIELLADRPEAIIEYDQLYCTPDTTHRRVQRILRDFGRPDASVLFLGDDDLGSVALSQSFEGSIHMIDLDDRLHDFIEEKAPSVHRHKADFILKGIPEECYQAFDAVVLDPPWDFFRLWCFLDKALFCLKDSPHARIYLCHCPLVLEHHLRQVHEFMIRLGQRGLMLDTVETAFNLYSTNEDDLPDFQQRLEANLPPIDSPLLNFLRLQPYAHAQLYVLRRLPAYHVSSLKQRWFAWWNRL